MKVTALMSDALITEVKRYAPGKTLTESLQRALQEWLALKKVARLNQEVRQRPLAFKPAFSAAKIRQRNRR